MRVMSVLLFVFLLAIPVVVQDALDWCEVDKPAETPLPEMQTLAEDYPPIAALVPLPPNSHYTQWAEGELNLSADRTRGFIAITNDETWKQELVGVNLEDNSIIFRITYREIDGLRPPTNEDYYSGVQFRGVQWMGDSNRIALQTIYICQSCGEYEPPPDDLYMIDEEGKLKALLKGEQSVIMNISPDGKYVLFGGKEVVSLLDVKSGERRDGLVPNYHADVPPYGTGVLYSLWENTQSALVFSHDTDYNDLTAPIRLWRIFVDGRPSEQVHQFEGLFVVLRVDRGQHFVAYMRVKDRERGDYRLMIMDIVSGQSWDITKGNPFRDLFWEWVFDASPAILRYRGVGDEHAHYVTQCQQ